MNSSNCNVYIYGDVNTSIRPITTLWTQMNRVYDRDMLIHEFLDEVIDDNPYTPRKNDGEDWMYEHITAETSERIK